MNIYTVDLAISVITLVMAYLIAVTVAGGFRAWVARAVGDDTAESLGLLTLNPLMHIDFLGAFFLLFLGFGWGRHVPINPFKIGGRFRNLNIMAAYFSDTFAHLVMATTVFTVLVLAFGPMVLNLATFMIYTGTLLQSQFAQAYPQVSSFGISLGLIGIALVFLNVLLAVLDFIISVFSLAAFAVLEGSPAYSRYRNILMIIIPMLMIYFFIDPLRALVVKLLYSFGHFIALFFFSGS